MNREELEQMALRPARFLRGLADIEYAQYSGRSYLVEDQAENEEVFTPSEDDDIRVGVAAFRVMPGGRWLVLASNMRTANVQASARGVIMLWDLQKSRLTWKYTVGRPMNFASLDPSTEVNGVNIVAGLDRSRAE